MSNFPNFQATFTSNTCAFTSSAGPLRAPYMDSLGPPPWGLDASCSTIIPLVSLWVVTFNVATSPGGVTGPLYEEG